MQSTGHPHQPTGLPLHSLSPGDILRLDAGAIVDGHALELAPASMLLRVDRTHPGSPPAIDAQILAIDHPENLPDQPDPTIRIDLHHSILMPGMVNAHAHLDLTHLGPTPHDPALGFMPWVEHVRMNRAIDDADIARSVREGIDLCLAAGTVAVGDIAGAPAGHPSLIPWRTLRESPLIGVSFMEFFAIGTREQQSLQRAGKVLDAAATMGSDGPMRLGLQPHAPYSASLSAYRWAQKQARRLDLAVCTHLAETAEEHAFIQDADGPNREFLERLGLWQDGLFNDVGRGLDPVAYLAEVLGQRAMLCAHVNDANDAAIATLVRTGASVVYCPRASEYFGAERVFGAHRYREMLDAGVGVALGSDSIVNLPSGTRIPGRGGISMLDEIRRLRSRDGTDPRALVGMATSHGARALGLDGSGFRFEVGNRPAGVVVVRAMDGCEFSLAGVVDGSGGCRLLFHGNVSGVAGMSGGTSQESFKESDP